ncbi:cholecystokinin receptor-like isoform X2 [Cyprinus carpio]|uniref:Cholecystokinin receptor-like isoform X2 n=1 Tax=Cyprinus carpio TaxID=7962 RepID=A0A9Q9VW46_CYPCA|nr:cholecystokinin receptor-like isoform X2 [Cyprinus carpio]
MDLQNMNETQIPFWEGSRTPENSSVNISALEVNATCSNASIIQKFKPTRPKGISVSISTFSLVAIAIERYSAICNPLKSRAWQTRSHAYKVITATWVLSVGIMVPYPVFSILVPFNKPNNITAHMCRLDWPISQVEQTWYVLLLFILFFIPGVVMIIAYGLISRELYRGIQFELEQKKESSGVKNGLNGALSSGHDESDGCYIQVPKKPPAMELSALTTSGTVKADRPRSNTSEAKLIAKKRVIRMLIIIVAMFFVCWMPLYSANTWKAFDQKSAQRALSGAPISFIQLLSYTSACVNPIIYCFMNTRFRKALLATFGCCSRPCHNQRKRREGDDEITGVTGASITKFSYTTVSTLSYMKMYQVGKAIHSSTESTVSWKSSPQLK